MPEGDTVRRTASRLHQALAGRPLVRTELRWPDLGEHDLAGRQVLEVVSYGKHILTRVSGSDRPPGLVGTPAAPLTLHSHLRMEGSWRLHATGTRKWPAPDQVSVRAVLAGSEWTAVGLWLGLLELVPTAEESSFLGHLGPDILDPEFAAFEALRRLRSEPARPVGEALLDQTNLAGIGTFYMAESLFVRGISPWIAIGDVPDLPALVEKARRMLTANLSRAVPTTTGVNRQGEQQWVHGRSGKPCRRCGTPVRVATLGKPPRERVAFYCPVCQPGPHPTDDGRPQAPLGASARGRPGTGVAEQAPRGRSAYRRR